MSNPGEFKAAFDHLATGESLRAQLLSDYGQEPLTQECDQCGRKYPATWSAGCFNAQGDDDCDGTIRPIPGGTHEQR